MTDVQMSLEQRLGPLEMQGMALADQIFDLVGGAIADGVIQPGEKVNDKELAAALGISRTPVREALQRLTWVGLVEVSPSRYTRVTEVTEDAVRSTLEHVGLQAANALRMAMSRMDEDEIAQAVALVDRVIEAARADDSEALMETTQTFCGYLVLNSGNAVFQRSMAESALLVARNLRNLQVRPGSAAHRVECFEGIRTGLLTGDADAAEHWFRSQHELQVDLVA